MVKNLLLLWGKIDYKTRGHLNPKLVIRESGEQSVVSCRRKYITLLIINAIYLVFFDKMKSKFSNNRFRLMVVIVLICLFSILYYSLFSL